GLVGLMIVRAYALQQALPEAGAGRRLGVKAQALDLAFEQAVHDLSNLSAVGPADSLPEAARTSQRGTYPSSSSAPLCLYRCSSSSFSSTRQSRRKTTPPPQWW